METSAMTGRRFGMLTVASDSGMRDRNRCILWRCICDCGGEILARRKELESGYVTNCGCILDRPQAKNAAGDLTGRRFGELTVIKRAPDDKSGKACWVCRCSCGSECIVRGSSLRNGHTKSCGCLRHGVSYNALDLKGQRFGRLVAVYRTNINTKDNSHAIWHCVCDCGGEIDVYAASLNSGRTRSCGCLNDEKRSRMHEHMQYRDDTCVERLKRVETDKIENRAGFRGLYITKDGRYRASITFRKAHYTLGYYKTYDEAVRARLDAEELLHKGYLDALEKYERSTKNDPDRANNDPFYYTVTRINGEFHIQTNGV